MNVNRITNISVILQDTQVIIILSRSSGTVLFVNVSQP